MEWAGRRGERGHVRSGALARRLSSVRVDLSFAAIDALLIAVAYTAALMLRFVEQADGVPDRWLHDFRLLLPLIIGVHLVSNIAFGTYGHIWEFASIAEATRIVVASVLAGSSLLAAVLALRNLAGVEGLIPVGTVVMGALLTVMLTGAVRFRTRLFSFRRGVEASAHDVRKVLIVGVGASAANVARHRSLGGVLINVVGFVAPEPCATDRRLAGKPVLGTLDDVPGLVVAEQVDEIILATKDGNHIVRRLVDLCIAIDVRLRIVPDLDSDSQLESNLQDVRDLEPDDLLDRPVVDTDLRQVEDSVAGKRVLVTGAGGSIGSELVRQILEFRPAALLVLEHDETHLHEATQKWSGSGVAIESILCDIRDRTRVVRAFDDHRPDVVFHAAAHKHVPILESCPEEAVKTNVLGTHYLLEASRRIGVQRFVLISTDKACDPASVMGASKRMAEMLVQSAAGVSNDPCVYSAVRFGNVLGSRGSVVPTFVDQIKRGGPVTVTDPEMTRYFMTIPEAVGLVLQASAIAEKGEILVLDMGEPVKILDLARHLIRMAGLVPGRDIDIVFTGRRPGEKLHEALSSVPLRPSSHQRIAIAEQGRPARHTLVEAVNRLVRLAAVGARDEIRTELMSLTGPGAETKITVDLTALSHTQAASS